MIGNMATVTAKVQESLLGVEAPANLSTESRARFLQHARQEEDGETYMYPDDFINAIAPPEEDYVSPHLAVVLAMSSTDMIRTAQNKERTICPSFPSRRYTQAG